MSFYIYSFYCQEDSESEYDDVVDDVPEPSTGRVPDSARLDPAMKHKLMRRKNLKQRFANLLRKFRVAEEQRTSEVSVTFPFPFLM